MAGQVRPAWPARLGRWVTVVVGVGVGALGAPARGQTAADDADAAQRMERARRAADNPMKRIQEAARLAAPPAVIRPATVTVTVPVKTSAPPVRPAPAAPAALPASPAPLAASLPPAPATVPEPSAAQAVEVPAPTAVPAPAAVPPSVTAPAVPVPASPPPPAEPTLVSMIEPEMPLTFDPSPFGSVLRFVVRFSIRADGQVSDVKVQAGPNDRGARAAVRQAVERWRYAPLPQDQAHEVELLLKLQG